MYISYNRNGEWTKAEKLPPFNSDVTEFSPKMTFDGKYFFFASTRNVNPATSAKAETTSEMNKRLRSVGNGLCDIYEVDIRALPARAD